MLHESHRIAHVRRTRTSESQISQSCMHVFYKLCYVCLQKSTMQESYWALMKMCEHRETIEYRGEHSMPLYTN